jgi:hypothetical protein
MKEDSVAQWWLLCIGSILPENVLNAFRRGSLLSSSQQPPQPQNKFKYKQRKQTQKMQIWIEKKKIKLNGSVQRGNRQTNLIERERPVIWSVELEYFESSLPWNEKKKQPNEKGKTEQEQHRWETDLAWRCVLNLKLDRDEGFKYGGGGYIGGCGGGVLWAARWAMGCVSAFWAGCIELVLHLQYSLAHGELWWCICFSYLKWWWPSGTGVLFFFFHTVKSSSE